MKIKKGKEPIFTGRYEISKVSGRAKMLSVHVSSVRLAVIGTFWYKNLGINSSYNFKVLMNFVNFSFVNFLAQNVLIPSDYILLISTKYLFHIILYNNII